MYVCACACACACACVRVCVCACVRVCARARVCIGAWVGLFLRVFRLSRLTVEIWRVILDDTIKTGSGRSTTDLTNFLFHILDCFYIVIPGNDTAKATKKI